MPRGAEKIVSNSFMRVLKKLHTDSKIQFGEKIRILSDFTVLPTKNAPIFGLGFTETDIAFYDEFVYDKKQATSPVFRFIRDGKGHSNVMRIPLVILELKRGRITSDAIRSRAMAARLIKQIKFQMLQSLQFTMILFRRS